MFDYNVTFALSVGPGIHNLQLYCILAKFDHHIAMLFYLLTLKVIGNYKLMKEEERVYNTV